MEQCVEWTEITLFIWKSNDFLFKCLHCFNACSHKEHSDEWRAVISQLNNIMLLSYLAVLRWPHTSPSSLRVPSLLVERKLFFPPEYWIQRRESIGAQPLPQLWQNKYTINIFCYGTVAYSGCRRTDRYPKHGCDKKKQQPSFSWIVQPLICKISHMKCKHWNCKTQAVNSP